MDDLGDLIWKSAGVAKKQPNNNPAGTLNGSNPLVNSNNAPMMGSHSVAANPLSAANGKFPRCIHPSLHY
jgi:hypothetical protein